MRLMKWIIKKDEQSIKEERTLLEMRYKENYVKSICTKSLNYIDDEN